MYDLPKRILFVAWLLAMGVAVTRLVIGIRTSAIPPDPLPSVARASTGVSLIPAAQPSPTLLDAAASAVAEPPAGEPVPNPRGTGRSGRRTRRAGTASADTPPQSTADAPSEEAGAESEADAGVAMGTPLHPEARFGGDFAPEAPLSAPEAREALRLVGVDPEAEAAWARAINDPDRPAEERKDLIEDLNEEGFPDPKHITADDLPLIRSRLALIEEMAPDAMDQANAEAFAEVYKDLLNLYNRFTRQ